MAKDREKVDIQNALMVGSTTRISRALRMIRQVPLPGKV